MNIILIRHGQAESFASDDASRMLTTQGEHQAQQTAAWLLNQGYQLDALIVSPYKRAQQTAYHVAQVFDIPITSCDQITPDNSAQAAFEWLDELLLPESATIAVVCHMPIVASLVMLLTGESSAGFSVAEAQVIEMPMFTTGLGKVIARFVPTV
ncbi:MAG: phosphohistidine phosphatase SixA [Moraxellaceae bacterium]|nr:phosphohistidine phosphatase SixA [Moraxellaceae bacterium]